MPRPSSSVWEHYLVISADDGKKHVTCSFCSLQYKHAMANKLKWHLLKCSKCPNDVKEMYKTFEVPETPRSKPSAKVKRSRSASKDNRRSVEVPLSSVSPTVTFDLDDFHRTTFTTQTSKHGDINVALARAIHATGQPLSLFESEHWKRAFNLFDPSYAVPTTDMLSNILQDLEYEKVKNGMDIKLAKSSALALIVDGWTNMIGKGITNFIITTPEPIFYHALDPEVHREVSELIGNQTVQILSDIGPAKFVILVTDNSTNMRAAWNIVKTEFPHISCIGCLSHSLNSIFKDIFKRIEFFKTTLDQIVKVIKYIKHTREASSQFEKYQAEMFGSSTCRLKLFNQTRWSGAYITVDSYTQNREALQLLAKSRNGNVTHEVKSIILDAKHWIKVDEIISILEPLLNGVLSSEKETALLSDVPVIFKEVYRNTTLKLGESAFIDPTATDLILTSIKQTEKNTVQPIHFAAHLLDPRYCDRNILDDEEISQASEFIRIYCTRAGMDEVKTLSGMAEFHTKKNFFEESKAIWTPAKQLDPRLWWKTFALKQSIGIIAAKILSVPPSTIVEEKHFGNFSRTYTNSSNCKSEPPMSLPDKQKGTAVSLADRSEDDYEISDNDSPSDENTDPLYHT